MATMATFVQSGAAVDYTPGSSVAAGDVIVQGTLVGVAVQAIAANALGSLAVQGVFDCAKGVGSSDAISAGAKVYWDSNNEVMTTTAQGNTYAGKAVDAAAAGDTTVRVRLEQ